MENDIISLIGMACTGGALVIWAKETFWIKREDHEEKETVFDYLWGLYDYAISLLHGQEEEIEEEETEQAWKKYARPQDPPKVKPGKYKITI